MAHHFPPFYHLHATEMDLHFSFIDILCEDHLGANAFQKDFIAIFPRYNILNVRQLDLDRTTGHSK